MFSYKEIRMAEKMGTHVDILRARSLASDPELTKNTTDRGAGKVDTNFSAQITKLS